MKCNKNGDMTVEDFLEHFNCAPYDDQELASIAKDVEGELGEAARKFLDASSVFDAALEDIDYERG